MQSQIILLDYYLLPQINNLTPEHLLEKSTYFTDNKNIFYALEGRYLAQSNNPYHRFTIGLNIADNDSITSLGKGILISNGKDINNWIHLGKIPFKAIIPDDASIQTFVNAYLTDKVIIEPIKTLSDLSELGINSAKDYGLILLDIIKRSNKDDLMLGLKNDNIKIENVPINFRLDRDFYEEALIKKAITLSDIPWFMRAISIYFLWLCGYKKVNQKKTINIIKANLKAFFI
jgi:hypothetical protein